MPGSTYKNSIRFHPVATTLGNNREHNHSRSIVGPAEQDQFLIYLAPNAQESSPARDAGKGTGTRQGECGAVPLAAGLGFTPLDDVGRCQLIAAPDQKPNNTAKALIAASFGASTISRTPSTNVAHMPAVITMTLQVGTAVVCGIARKCMPQNVTCIWAGR